MITGPGQAGLVSLDEAARAVADLVGGFAPIEAFEDVGYLSGRLRAAADVPVSIIADPPTTVFDAALLVDVLVHAAERIATAARAVDPRADDWRAWDPEIAFLGGRAWSVRFESAPGGGELGLLIQLEGTEVTLVDRLDELDDDPVLG